MRLEAPQEGHIVPKSTIQTARKHKWANLLNKYYFQDLCPPCGRFHHALAYRRISVGQGESDPVTEWYHWNLVG